MYLRNNKYSTTGILNMATNKVVCENCFYKGERSEFEKSSDYCKECISDHAMCPKCKTAYHSAVITE